MAENGAAVLAAGAGAGAGAEAEAGAEARPGGGGELSLADRADGSEPGSGQFAGLRRAGRGGERPAEGQGPDRRVGRAVRVGLDQAEHGHGRTPSESSTSTRAGTASAPVPRIRACLAADLGTSRRSFRSQSVPPCGSACSMTARFARSLPGSDG